MSRRHPSATQDTNEYNIYRQEFPEIPFDRYKITQHVGKGAFSKVFLAYTPEFQRRAIKRIRLTAKPHQLLKEIEFLRRLEGKSEIVQIKEIRFAESTLQTTVITNYSDTDDFKSVILDFTPREIQAYMRSILTALSHLENLSILHRDIKPGNFLFERKTGKGLLIDFGLAQTLREVREFPLLRGQSKSRKGVINIDLDKVRAATARFLESQGQGQGGSASASSNSLELPKGLSYSKQLTAKAGVSGQTVGTYPMNTPSLRPNEETSARLPISGYINKDQSNLRPLPPSAHSGTHGYRAPEILVPVCNQNCKIDTWSVGVILIQIITGKTSLFRGNPTLDIYELLAIRSIIGTDRFIQGMSRLNADFSLTAGSPMPQAISLEEMCEWYNPDLLAVIPSSCFDLCRRLLEFDPERRLSASQALSHPFLTMDETLLPNYRFQDGAHSKSLMSFTGYTGSSAVTTNNLNGGSGLFAGGSTGGASKEEETFVALHLRSADIADRLGLCKITAATLSEEYSAMTPSAMIPLPRELRKQVHKSVTKYGMDKSSQGPTGIIVERNKPTDYAFPTNASVQDLSSCAGCSLSRPRLAAAPGSAARHCAVDYLLKQRLREAAAAGQQGSVASGAFLRETLDIAWEAANRDKESFERAVRSTAIRRRLDPWVQPLKALDKELRLCQREVRKSAEEYRRLVLRIGLADAVRQDAEAEASGTRNADEATTPGDDGATSEQISARSGKPSAGLSRNSALAVASVAGVTSTVLAKVKEVITARRASGRLAVSAAAAAAAPTQETYVYPNDYTVERIRNMRLVNFILHSELVDAGGAGGPDGPDGPGDAAAASAANAATAGLCSSLALRAWAQVETATASARVTREKGRRIFELTLKAARLAAISHRIAISGPDTWEAKNESYFLSQNTLLGANSIRCDEILSHIHELNTKISQHLQHLSQTQFCNQERADVMAKCRAQQDALAAQARALAVQIKHVESTLNNKAYDGPAAMQALQQDLARLQQDDRRVLAGLATLGTVIGECQTFIATNKRSYEAILEDYNSMLANKEALQKEYEAEYAAKIKNADYSNENVALADGAGAHGGLEEGDLDIIDNFSDLWSETISVSDEGSEAKPALKPFGVYDPTMLQEPFFTSLEEMKRALRNQDIASDRRKSRREQRRRLESLIARRRDPILEEVRAITNDIQRAKKDLVAEMSQMEADAEGRARARDAGANANASANADAGTGAAVSERRHNGLIPRRSLAVAPSLLSQAVAIKTLAKKYATVLAYRRGYVAARREQRRIPRTRAHEQTRAPHSESAEGEGAPVPAPVPVPAPLPAGLDAAAAGRAAPALERKKAAVAAQQLALTKNLNRASLSYINTKIQAEKKAHALLTLISSPYGRFLMPIHKIIQEGSPFPPGTRSNSLYIMCIKSDVFIPQELQESILTLQALSSCYFSSAIGRKDLILVCAACQSELDLRAQNAANNTELQHLGLSKRSPNLDYMLLLQGRLSSLIPYYPEDTRSTSAISGLAKSATHRSLADPSRTSQRYPQTCKYMQTIIEQILRRYVAMPGVLKELQDETTSGILSIKGRILEVVVIELLSQAEAAASARGGAPNVYAGHLRLIKYCIETLGAGTVFDIIRGMVYPMTLLRGTGVLSGSKAVGGVPGGASSGVPGGAEEPQQTSAAEDVQVAARPAKREFLYVDEADIAAVTRLARSPDAGVTFDEHLVAKIDDSNARRRMLLQAKYGGRRHQAMLRRMQKRERFSAGVATAGN